MRSERYERHLSRLGRVIAGCLAAMLVCALGLLWVAHAEEANPPCVPRLPDPPLVVVLPDGTEVPATTIRYELSSRRVVVVGYTRVFCDGVEGGD